MSKFLIYQTAKKHAILMDMSNAIDAIVCFGVVTRVTLFRANILLVIFTF